MQKFHNVFDLGTWISENTTITQYAMVITAAYDFIGTLVAEDIQLGLSASETKNLVINGMPPLNDAIVQERLKRIYDMCETEEGEDGDETIRSMLIAHFNDQLR